MKKRKKKKDIRYIQCGDHKWRRWSIVCIHLCEGISREWIALPNPDGPDDYLCPECLKNWDWIMSRTGEGYRTDIRPVCVMCIERIRVKFDPKYQSLS